MKKLAKGALAIGFAGMMVAGCSSTYTRDELIKDLKDGGLSESMSTCMADGFEKAGIKIEKWTGDKNVTPEQEKVITECATKEVGLPVTTTK